MIESKVTEIPQLVLHFRSCLWGWGEEGAGNSHKQTQAHRQTGNKACNLLFWSNLNTNLM